MSNYISRDLLKRKLNAWDSKANGIPNYVWKVIDELPSADVIEIPEGLTNEDVLNDTLRRVFSRVFFIRSIDELNKTQGIHMSEEWLRQPYKGADMRGDT